MTSLFLSLRMSSYTVSHHSYYRNNHSYYRNNASCTSRSLKLLQQERPYLSQALSRKKMTGGINGGLLNEATLKSLDFKRDFLFPLSLLLHNTRPVSRQVLDGYSFSTSLLFSFLYSPISLIYFCLFFISGYSSAFHYYHAFGRSFCHTSHITSVLLDFSWCFPCCTACSSSILAFSIPRRLECLIQQGT